MRVVFRAYAPLSVAIALLLLASVYMDADVFIRNVYEDVSMRIAPSAERAYGIGVRHFDSARYPRSYDIGRAARYFGYARQLDPRHPYVYHQLARIAFLRGDFAAAKDLIDAQIKYHSDVPNSYYMRGLIEGYMGLYDAAAQDYAAYLKHDSTSWAAINDYAWVLLKAGRFSEALAAAESGLKIFPRNAWLLNSHAIAQYELGDYEGAYASARRAAEAVRSVTEEQWTIAYPGNDPKIAPDGITTLKRSIERNMHMAQVRLAPSAIQ